MAAGTATVEQASPWSGATRSRGRVADIVFQVVLLFLLILSLAFLVALIAQVLLVGLPVLGERGTDFLTAKTSSRAARAGVSQGIVGSLLVLGFVVIVSFPIGIASAIYLEEYAPDTRLTRFIDLNIRNLAGVPSVVYGLLGLAIFVKVLGGVTGGPSVITGGLTIAILVLPIVIITTAEALRAVPMTLREGGYGLGATRWEVTRRLVLPYAAPGILTGTVLSISRAIGETAPLIVVGVVTGFIATGSQDFIETLRGSYTTLPAIIFDWSRQPDRDIRELAAAAIIVLLAVTMLANAAAIILRNRYSDRGR